MRCSSTRPSAPISSIWLARRGRPARRGAGEPRSGPCGRSIQHLLEGITGAAALVHNARLDNLAGNQLGRALYSEMFAHAAGRGQVNSARYVFLDPHAREFYADWDRAARDVAAILRYAAGRDPYDRDLSDLVGELSTQSEEFRIHWAAHNVRLHDTGDKDYHHPVVGDLTLTYNRLDLSADEGLTITVWTAEPGSKSAEALNLLGSWAATLDQARPTPGRRADERPLRREGRVRHRRDQRHRPRHRAGVRARGRERRGRRRRRGRQPGDGAPDRAGGRPGARRVLRRHPRRRRPAALRRRARAVRPPGHRLQQRGHRAAGQARGGDRRRRVGPPHRGQPARRLREHEARDRAHARARRRRDRQHLVGRRASRASRARPRTPPPSTASSA